MSKSDSYNQYLNDHILPLIDYGKLSESYETDMIYAKGLLNRLHQAMVEIYGSDRITESDGNEGFVLIPGILRGINTGIMCIALFDLDLSSQGEHWGTDFLYLHGISSQTNEQNEEIKEILSEMYIPYDYCYTADIPCDIHVNKDKLPDDLKEVLNDFRNHNIELLQSGSND